MGFNFLKIIALILNCSPLLHISEDSNFGSVDNLSVVRLSFLAIPFGRYKIYLLSIVIDRITHKWKIEGYYRLSFYAICKQEDQAEIDDKTSAYKTLIGSHSEEEINIQIDFLKEKFNKNQNRISTAYNKINNYVAINLVHIGFIGYLLTELLSIKNDSLYFIILSIILFISAIYTWNYFLFITFGLSVKTFIRSKFGGLKSDPTNEQLAASYYTDWYSSENEAKIISSIVCNIEDYFIRSIYITIFLWSCIIVNNNCVRKTVSATLSYENENLIINKSNEFLLNYLPNYLVDINKANSAIYSISKEGYTHKAVKYSVKIPNKKHKKIRSYKK